MKWFGRDRAFSAACEGKAVPVPVGDLCHYCDEAIAQGDYGYILPYTSDSGTRLVPEHFACFLRQVTGSVAHVQMRCSCFVDGSEEGDPPGMTRRQAAEAAVLEWERVKLEVSGADFGPKCTKPERVN